MERADVDKGSLNSEFPLFLHDFLMRIVRRVVLDVPARACSSRRAYSSRRTDADFAPWPGTDPSIFAPWPGIDPDFSPWPGIRTRTTYDYATGFLNMWTPNTMWTLRTMW